MRGFIAEFDDFGNHLALGLVERALFGAEFYERIDLVFGEMTLLFQLGRKDGLRDPFGEILEQAGHRIEQGSEAMKDGNAEPRNGLWRAEGQELRQEVADEYDQREEDERERPRGQVEVTMGLNHSQTAHEEGRVDDGISEKDAAEQAAGVFQHPDERGCKAALAFFERIEL